jgi:hypothetical protein
MNVSAMSINIIKMMLIMVVGEIGRVPSVQSESSRCYHGTFRKLSHVVIVDRNESGTTIVVGILNSFKRTTTMMMMMIHPFTIMNCQFILKSMEGMPSNQPIL